MAQSISDVFSDAKKLQETYRRLSLPLQLKFNSRQTQGKKEKKSLVKKAASAQRELEEYNHELLTRLTPQLFQQVILLEWDDASVDSWKGVVTFQLLRVAAQSVSNAKRLGHLIIQVTLFKEASVSFHEANLYHNFLLTCMIAGKRFPNMDKMADYHAFRFVEQLVIAAQKGDGEAYEYLRLFYRALRFWRVDLQPKKVSEYTIDFVYEWMAIKEVLHERKPGIVPMSMCYDDLCYAILEKAREDENRRFAEAVVNANSGFWRRVTAISLTAYDGFISAMWHFIASQKVPNVVLAGGRDKIVVQVPYLNYSGIVSFSFVRECNDGRIFPFPEVGVNIFMEKLCEHKVSRMTLTAEGKMKEFEDAGGSAEYMTIILWCLVVDAYAEIVIPAERRDSLDNPRRNRQRVQRIHHPEGESIVVRPHFRKLPLGWMPSQRQVDEAITAIGAPPMPGYTFVGECQRSFPGYAVPDKEGQDLWRVHKDLKPTLTLTGDYVTALLEHIPSFE